MVASRSARVLAGSLGRAHAGAGAGLLGGRDGVLPHPPGALLQPPRARALGIAGLRTLRLVIGHGRLLGVGPLWVGGCLVEVCLCVCVCAFPSRHLRVCRRTIRGAGRPEYPRLKCRSRTRPDDSALQ
eukprot:5072949-Prymnesium_polylepis.1